VKLKKLKPENIEEMQLQDRENVVLSNDRKIILYKNLLLHILVRRKGIIVLESTRSGREPEVGTCQPTDTPLGVIRVADFYLHKFINFTWGLG
jgi:hypothetical protein